MRSTANEYEVVYRLSTASGWVPTHDQLLEWVWTQVGRASLS